MKKEKNDRQDVPCMYPAHHEPESANMIVIDVIIIIDTIIVILIGCH